MNSIAELRASLGDKSPEYIKKQMHRVPDFPVVERELFILERVAGKVVLDIGASGPMHEAIVEVAKQCHGIDRKDGDGVVGVNLDNINEDEGLPRFEGVEIVVCGEVIEHLANPGRFLEELRFAYCASVIFTVPNAGSEILQHNLRKGIECVNSDHVAWYSWKTLSVLLGRYGYEPKEWAWYGPASCKGLNEGIICVAE